MAECAFCGNETPDRNVHLLIRLFTRKKRQHNTCMDCVKFMADVTEHNIAVARKQFVANREAFYSNFKGQDNIPFIMPQLNIDMVDMLLAPKKKKDEKHNAPTYIG